MVKNPPVNAGDARNVGLISGSGWSPGVGNGNRLQYACLKNSMDREAWRATVHGVTKSLTGLSVRAHTHTHTHTHTREWNGEKGVRNVKDVVFIPLKASQ